MIAVDPATERLLGWSMDELLGRSVLEIVDPADHERAIEAWVDMLAGLDSDRLRVRYLTKSGEQRWIEVTSTNRLDDPDAGYVEVEMIDVHDEMLALNAARSREAQYETLTESLPVGVVQVDGDGDTVYANRWLRDLTSTPEGEPLGCRSVAESDQLALDEAFANAMLHGEPIDLDVVLFRGRDGTPRNCRFRVRTLGVDAEAGQLGAIASIEDITDTLRHQQRLHDQARQDFLTGLPNRLAVNEWLEALRSPGTDHTGITMLYFDLDGFKDVNDRLGHAAGDDLLCNVADAARGLVGAGGLLARVGGDEFVIGLAGCCKATQVEQLAHDVLGLFERPFAVGDTEVDVGCSVGVARCTDEREIALLLTMSDIAMYRAKRAGGHRWHLYDGGSDPDALTEQAVPARHGQ